MKNWRFLLPLMMLVSGCATKQTYTQSKRGGSWTAKAQLRELNTGKTQQVNMQIVGVSPDKLRVDVSAMLGISVASLALNQDEFRLNLYRDKKYYQGVASEKILTKVFKVPLNPKWLINMTFDQPIRERGWSCAVADHTVSQCSRASDGMTVTWSDREGEKKRVVLTNATHELQILYKDFSEVDMTKVQATPGPFVLDAPEGFSKINVN